MPTLARFLTPMALAIVGALPLAPTTALAQMDAGGDLVARPGVDPDAARLVAEAKVAWSALESLTASVELGGTGGMGAFSPKSTGDLLAKRADGVWIHRATGHAVMAVAKKKADFDTVWDRRATTWVDHEAQTVTTAVNGSGFTYQMADATRPLGLFGARPFYALENASVLTLGDPSRIDGLACDVIEFVEKKANAADQSGATYRWHIAREDKLPRRIEQVVDSGTLSGSMLWTLSNVRTGAQLPDSAFSLATPAGYETKGVTVVTSNARVDDGDPPPPDAPRGTPRFNKAEGPGVIGASPMAPDFTLATLDNKDITLSELRGQFVLLDFWGTWCVPCKKASPFVQELHEDYKDKGLVVLAPAFRSPDEEITKYFDDHKYTYTPLPNAERLVQEYRIRAFPTFVLIGPRGQELERFVGGKPENTFPTIRKMLDRFMEEQG